jgi:hypothetical protein
MASPFRNSKKDRRGWRKAATNLVAILDRREDVKPEIEASLKRTAKIYLRIAGAKRRNP